MATSTFSTENVARQRAYALITAFCQATADEDLDEQYGEIFYEIIDEIVDDKTPLALQQTIIALVSVVKGTLDHLDIECDNNDILPGLVNALSEETP